MTGRGTGVTVSKKVAVHRRGPKSIGNLYKYMCRRCIYIPFDIYIYICIYMPLRTANFFSRCSINIWQNASKQNKQHIHASCGGGVYIYVYIYIYTYISAAPHQKAMLSDVSFCIAALSSQTFSNVPTVAR